MDSPVLSRENLNHLKVLRPETDEEFELCDLAVPVSFGATDYCVSPCDRDGTIDFATVKETLALLDGWSLSVQLHKVLGFR